MAIFSYVVTHDTGFAPNPFWGRCTLACCKPAIRRCARVGDWIVGLSPKSRDNRLVYSMEVAEVLSYDAYFRDKRFQAKKPDFRTGGVVNKCGDNIYRPAEKGVYVQLRSTHSKKDGSEDVVTKAHDLGGRNVLIAGRFWYRGRKGIELPKELRALVVGRGHRREQGADVLAALESLLSQHDEGVAAPPHRWPADDASWMPRRK